MEKFSIIKGKIANLKINKIFDKTNHFNFLTFLCDNTFVKDIGIFFKNNVFCKNILKNRVVGKEIIRIRLFSKLFSKICVFLKLEEAVYGVHDF